MTPPAAGPAPSQPLPSQPLPITAAMFHPPRVAITFEYTFEDLREGLASAPEQRQQRQGRQIKARTAAGLLGWVLFVATAVFFFMLLNRPRMTPAARVPRPSPPTVDLLIAAGPSALAALLMTILFAAISLGVVMLMQKNTKVRDAGKRLPTVAVFLVMLVGGVGAAALWWQREPSGWTVSYRLAMALALLPWLLVIVLALVFASWLSRTHVRLNWQSRPHLRRRRTVVLDADGERATDDVTDLLYRWPHFRQAWETANLLVLLDENELRHILPKRVMDAATLEQARALISNHVPETHFLTTPGGFPVGTPAPPSESPPPAPAPPR